MRKCASTLASGSKRASADGSVFKAKLTPALERKQYAVLSFGQHVVEMQRLDGFKTMAERRTRAGFMKSSNPRPPRCERGRI
jgi:hypothetical protein